MEEVVFGQTVQISIQQWKHHPSLKNMTTGQAVKALFGTVVGEGAVPTGPAIALDPYFSRRVKVHHHPHGWEMAEVQCEEAEADLVQLRFEVRALRPTPHPSSA